MGFGPLKLSMDFFSDDVSPILFVLPTVHSTAGVAIPWRSRYRTLSAILVFKKGFLENPEMNE